MEVDEDRYNELVLIQKQTARNARKVGSAEGWRSGDVQIVDLPETVFTGYDEMSSEAEILALLGEGGAAAETASENENAVIILNKTPFYPGGGGQIADTGIIEGEGYKFSVTETVKTPKNVILHKVSVISGSINAGVACRANVDENRRKAIQRDHTAAHLLQAALRNRLGTHVEQAGQLVNENVCRFDFTHFSPLTSEEISDIEREVNCVILSSLPVVTTETTIEEAKKRGAMALFGEKYGDTVRMVDAGGYSIELCGGTHVKNTGEIGLFKIISEASVASGVRRVEVITGLNALEYLNNSLLSVHRAASALKCSADSLADRASAVQAELKAKDRELEKLKAEIASANAANLVTKAAEKNGIEVFTANAGEADAGALRTLLDSVKNDSSVIVAAGKNTEKGICSFACVCGKNAVASGAHAGNIVRAVAQIAGGSGGGKPDSAMAGGKDVTKIDDALNSVADVVTAMLK